MKYPFNVVFTKDGADTYWLAKSCCLKGCIGQGQTMEEALEELAGNESMWLETAIECGIDIPDIPIEEENTYSGKLSLRMSPEVHKRAATIAKQEGISLNQYVNDAIVNYNAELSTGVHIATRIESIAKQTLKVIDESVCNFKMGNVSDPIDLSDLKSL